MKPSSVKASKRGEGRFLEDYVNDWIGENHGDFAMRLNKLSRAMRRTAGELKEGPENELVYLLRAGADGMETLSRQVQKGECEDLMDTLENQCRENPAGALLASMAAGVLCAPALHISQQSGGEETDEGTAVHLSPVAQESYDYLICYSPTSD